MSQNSAQGDHIKIKAGPVEGELVMPDTETHKALLFLGAGASIVLAAVAVTAWAMKNQ